jgi:hypothetical protein
MADLPLAAPLALCAIGPVLLRYGWQHRRWPVIAGWAIITLAAAMLATAGGAWSMALGTTVSMGSAALLLAHAALATAAAQRVVQQRIPAPLPPVPIDWPDVARRCGVFSVVVILDAAASLWLSWALQQALFQHGVSEADTTALALFLFPLLWLLLASWQMTCERLAVMARAPLALAILGGVLWLTT